VVKNKVQWSDTKSITKTESSTRILTVPPEIIQEFKLKQDKNPNTTYVFQSKKGNPIDPKNFYRDYKLKVEEAVNSINIARKRKILIQIR